MKLRSCENLHYFSVIIGGTVVKALNVSYGRPLIKFKTLRDIYEAEDERNQSPNDELGGSSFDTIKAERPTITNSDVSESSCDEKDGGSSSELNDISSSKMSLKQIKQSSKAMKRKRSIIFADDESDLMEPLIKFKSKISKKPGGKSRSLKNTGELHFQVKQEAEEDESDLTEPLMTWKVKLPKKLKRKARSLKHAVFVPPQSPNQGVEESSEQLPVFVDVKVEAVETYWSQCQIVTGDFSLIYDGQVDSSSVSQSSREEVVMASDSSLICDDKEESYGVDPSEAFKTEATSSPTEDLQPLVLIQDTNSESISVLCSPVDSCETVTREVADIAPESFSGTDELTSVIEKHHICVLNEAGYDYVEYDDSEPVQSVLAPFFDNISAIDDVKDTRSSDLPVPESEGEDYVDKPLCTSISHVMIPNRHLPEPSNDVTPFEIDCSSSNGCFQEIESTSASNECKRDDDAKADLTSILETGALQSSCGEFSLVPQNCFTLSPENSPNSEAEQSQQSSTIDVAGKSCEDHEELTASDDDYKCDSNPDSPPHRLLSTRKSISPDSQEKLCQSMESIEIHEDGHFRPQNKFCFDQQNGKETKSKKTERSGRISDKHMVRKSKHEKRNTLPNGVPRFTTGSTSIESCAQSAIAFSQLQMEDFQSLAAKLVEELKSMKEVAEDRLCNGYKTREAISRAGKAEQVATKLLSTMARDCNRFCKIMTIALSKEESAVTETKELVNKQQKKISFADETGEELCRVKLFDENLTELFVRPEIEKSEELN